MTRQIRLQNVITSYSEPKEFNEPVFYADMWRLDDKKKQEEKRNNDWTNDLSNPCNPISPLNPANPCSPLNPIFWG